MSMITGCPACGTLFRVVPDQLKISEGWVRCGHCSEVFDARAHLQPQWQEQEAAAPGPHPLVAPEAGAGPASKAGSGAAGPEPETSPAPAPPDEAVALAEPALAPQPGPAPQPAPTPEPVGPSDPQPSEPEAVAATGEPTPAAALEPVPLVAVAPHEPAGPPSAEVTDAAPPAASEPVPTPPPPLFGAGAGYTLDFVRESSDPDPEPVGSVPSPAPRQETDEDLVDVSFLREARRKAFWQRPLVRTLLALLALALLAVLGVQVAVQERDRLAAWRPQLRSVLEPLCAPLGCTVQAPRRIDAIVIDSSGFSRLRPETYRLSFTLRNQSGLPVAVPALELTLTDTQDQPVLRRVLTPADLAAPAETLAAGGDWSASVAIAVAANGASGRIAGYRLLAFYP